MAQGNELAAAIRRLTEVMERVAGREEAAAREGAAAQRAAQEFGNRNEIMVSLINSHNPYTSNDVGDMSVFVRNPDPDNHRHLSYLLIKLKQVAKLLQEGGGCGWHRPA
jgi:hypothetical protein